MKASSSPAFLQARTRIRTRAADQMRRPRSGACASRAISGRAGVQPTDLRVFFLPSLPFFYYYFVFFFGGGSVHFCCGSVFWFLVVFSGSVQFLLGGLRGEKEEKTYFLPPYRIICLLSKTLVSFSLLGGGGEFGVYVGLSQGSMSRTPKAVVE